MDLKKIKIWIYERYLKTPRFRLAMDVSPCNFRCAMCPRGGISGLKNENRELMSFELFKRIIGKFLKEKVKIRYIEIGNWGEPLLNPDFCKMMTYARDRLKPEFLHQEDSIHMNTNLSFLKDPAELLESGVDLIRISVSGMTGETYSKNHIGGNIELVLNNIVKLADIKNKRKIEDVTLEMRFHNLVYNQKEAEKARKFCQEHGLIFTHFRMFIPCVEQCVRFHREKERLSKFYANFINLAEEQSLMKTLDKARDCWLRKDFVTLNPAGQLCRCCGVFDQSYLMGNFFDFKIRDIPRIESEICKECIKTPISFR